MRQNSRFQFFYKYFIRKRNQSWYFFYSVPRFPSCRTEKHHKVSAKIPKWLASILALVDVPNQRLSQEARTIHHSFQVDKWKEIGIDKVSLEMRSPLCKFFQFFLSQGILRLRQSVQQRSNNASRPLWSWSCEKGVPYCHIFFNYLFWNPSQDPFTAPGPILCSKNVPWLRFQNEY